jgi:hypothetical protein
MSGRAAGGSAQLPVIAEVPARVIGQVIETGPDIRMEPLRESVG